MLNLKITKAPRKSLRTTREETIEKILNGPRVSPELIAGSCFGIVPGHPTLWMLVNSVGHAIWGTA